jgi:hypothetical protein
MASTGNTPQNNPRDRAPAGRSQSNQTRRPDAAPIAMKGTLVVRWINGRNGAFAVGDLHTSIGEFSVKDALLDQFDAGEYSGMFWVSQIASRPYEYRGRITVETRASIADLQIDDERDAPPDAPGASEPDPADEPKAAPPTPAPVPTPKPVPATPESVPQPAGLDGEDEALFGAEMYMLVTNGLTVKLDPTVDRMRFRTQKERLKVLGYSFDAKTQSWYRN